MGKRVALILFVVLVALACVGAYAADRQTQRALADAAVFQKSQVTIDSLPVEWRKILLAVEDPAFYRHHGIDVRTPGAGWTTITQSLAKRYCFDNFRKGVFNKAWQSFCAVVVDAEIPKDQQLTLFINTASMGPGRSGWITGFPAAAQEFFGKPLRSLDRTQFISLVAMLVAPANLNPRNNPEALAERVRRIDMMLAGQCSPRGFRDVYLEGCAESKR
jgi:membrane peptidoglycan carboxypeptidase